MKLRHITILASALTLAVAFAVFAEEKKNAKTAETKAPAATTAEATAETAKATVDPSLGNQTHCPVMGGAIDSSIYTDIQGHRVYHCCPMMCPDKLVADPDKYFKKAAEDGIRFENIQTNCPVSNEPIAKDKFVDFEGRRVFVCCDKCAKTFSKDPAKYIAALTVKSDAKAETKAAGEKTEDHSGHNH